MADDLEKRLESHGRAFEGLMSLIPAKLYYEQDNSDQWRRKKQTKEEKRAARKAKLDPRNIKSAKDVMDENERKRKREAGEEVDEPGLSDGEGKEQPGEGLKHGNKHKKRRVDGELGKTQNQSGEQVDDEQSIRNADKRREKRARQSEKRHQDKEKEKEKQKKRKEKLKPLIKAAKEAKRAGAANTDIVQEEANSTLNDQHDVENEDEAEAVHDISVASKITQSEPTKISNPEETSHDATHITQPTPSLDSKSTENPALISLTRLSPSDLSSNPDSTFSPALDQHATTSESSIDDISVTTSQVEKPESVTKQSRPAISEHKESKEVLRARLEAKIAALRAARKADGEDGKPIRTRQELIEHRRVKELERKQRKKKQQRETDAAQDEAAQKARAEAELARLRGDTGSPITGSAARSRSHSVDSFSMLPGGSSLNNNNNNPAKSSKLNLDGLSYSRLAFADGDQLTALNQNTLTPLKHKSAGPIDAKSALAKAEARAARLATLDDATRADIESKELWQRARQRVAGDKPRDDVSLLKKTLKKREKQKLKSEREWNERKDGVARAQEARQKKRETNLAKRKDEKGSGSGGKKSKKKLGGKGGGAGKKGGSSDKLKAKRERHKAFG